MLHSPLPKDNPSRVARDYLITELACQGMTSREIAKHPDINIKARQVRNILSDDQCKEIIDKTVRKYIAHSKGISNKLLQHAYCDDRKVSLDAIKHLNCITGISPSNTTNNFIAHIYNDNRSIITGDVGRLLGMLSTDAAGEDDVVDI